MATDDVNSDAQRLSRDITKLEFDLTRSSKTGPKRCRSRVVKTKSPTGGVVFRAQSISSAIEPPVGVQCRLVFYIPNPPQGCIHREPPSVGGCLAWTADRDELWQRAGRTEHPTAQQRAGIHSESRPRGFRTKWLAASENYILGREQAEPNPLPHIMNNPFCSGDPIPAGGQTDDLCDVFGFDSECVDQKCLHAGRSAWTDEAPRFRTKQLPQGTFHRVHSNLIASVRPRI
jgi:hypothetical protein